MTGHFTVGSGTTLVPAGSIGALTFSNELTLSTGCTDYFEVSNAPLANNVASVFDTLACGGTLIITNIGATALARATASNFSTRRVTAAHSAK